MAILSSSGTATSTYFPVSSPFEYSGTGAHPLAKWLHQGAAYGEIYRRQVWANICVNKLVGLATPLPRKVYRRAPKGRVAAPESPLGRLMASPSSVMDANKFWGWFWLMYHTHGRAVARKVRDAGGRPVEFEAIHPTRFRYGPPKGDPYGRAGYWFVADLQTMEEVRVDRREYIVLDRMDPDNALVGMSPFEPLRQTLQNDYLARCASDSLWKNGGKPGFVLTHPSRFNNPRTSEALATQFQAKHGGVENWGKPLVLQEGMQALPLEVKGKELQYIETRELGMTETIAEFDIPPHAVGDLRHATFSNVTEENRSLYRQTMPPHLTAFESMIEFDLRDGRFGEDREPDFGSDFYFEHLMDGVLRGAFEERVAALSQGVSNGLYTLAEARDMDNRPFIEGSDQLFVNGALVPLGGEGGDKSSPRELAEIAQKLYLGTERRVLFSQDEARNILNEAGAGLTGPAPTTENPADPGTAVALARDEFDTVMGRLGRITSLDQIDGRLTEGLSGPAEGAVQGAVAIARYGHLEVAELREIVKRIGRQ